MHVTARRPETTGAPRTRSWRWTFLILMVLGLVSTQAQAVDNGTEAVTVGDRTVDVTFNTPGNNAQWDEAARLIRAATAGSTIRLGVYNLSSQAILDAVQEALDDNVNVWAVVNGEHHGETGLLLDELKTKLGTRFRWCDRDASDGNPNDACISNDVSGLMHAKFMTFSQTRGRAGNIRDNVVWVSSANFSGSGIDMYNNSVTVYEDSALYNGFQTDVWQPMWDDPGYANNDFYFVDINRGYFQSNASNSTVYVSPEQTTDLWANRLDYVDADSTCTIRVMHNTFNSGRSEVASKLHQLAVDGCTVNVITKTMDASIRNILDPSHPRVTLHTANVHDKSIVINAKYAGSTSNRYIVFTGSHNLSESALTRNDEIIIKLADSKPLFDLFVDHFRHAWNS